MTFPISAVKTYPYCGACGYDVVAKNAHSDKFCDSCGADLQAFGFGGQIPPTDVEATGGSLSVVFTFVANPQAESTTVTYTIDGGTEVVLEDQTSPVTVVAAEGEEVCATIASVANGATGPSTAAECDVATA